jgi:hypothetical protein
VQSPFAPLTIDDPGVFLGLWQVLVRHCIGRDCTEASSLRAIKQLAESNLLKVMNNGKEDTEEHSPTDRQRACCSDF